MAIGSLVKVGARLADQKFGTSLGMTLMDAKTKWINLTTKNRLLRNRRMARADEKIADRLNQEEIKRDGFIMQDEEVLLRPTEQAEESFRYWDRRSEEDLGRGVYNHGVDQAMGRHGKSQPMDVVYSNFMGHTEPAMVRQTDEGLEINAASGKRGLIPDEELTGRERIADLSQRRHGVSDMRAATGDRVNAGRTPTERPPGWVDHHDVRRTRTKTAKRAADTAAIATGGTAATEAAKRAGAIEGIEDHVGYRVGAAGEPDDDLPRDINQIQP